MDNMMKNSTSQLLSYKQLEEAFGIHRSTAATYVYLRRIPHIKLGPRNTRFDREEIEAWIDSKRVPPLEQKQLALPGVEDDK